MDLKSLIENNRKVRNLEESNDIYKVTLEGSLAGKELFVKILERNNKFVPYMSYFVGTKPSDVYYYSDDRNTEIEALQGVLITGLQSYNPNTPREDHITYENDKYF